MRFTLDNLKPQPIVVPPIPMRTKMICDRVHHQYYNQDCNDWITYAMVGLDGCCQVFGKDHGKYNKPIEVI